VAAANNNARDSLTDVELESTEVAEVESTRFVVAFDFGLNRLVERGCVVGLLMMRVVGGLSRFHVYSI
jgi:hypothetical protein